MRMLGYTFPYSNKKTLAVKFENSNHEFLIDVSNEIFNNRINPCFASHMDAGIIYSAISANEDSLILKYNDGKESNIVVKFLHTDLLRARL